MADDAVLPVLDEPVCPTCKVNVEMTEQGGPFGSDTYSCPSCGAKYEYQTPPDPDWEPPKTGGGRPS